MNFMPNLFNLLISFQPGQINGKIIFGSVFGNMPAQIFIA
jgi:hypothetical protein